MPRFHAQHNPKGVQPHALSSADRTLRYPRQGKLVAMVIACAVFIGAGCQRAEPMPDSEAESPRPVSIVFADEAQAHTASDRSSFDQTTLSDPDNLWEVLAQYTYDRSRLFDFVVTFSEDVQALDGTEITLQGFIIPLDQGVNITHFLLSTYPLADCYFCLPGGPESFVEVRTEEPILFTFEPIQIQGTLSVLKQDEIKELGLFYRMNEAQQVADK